MMLRRSLLLASCLIACNSLDEPGPKGESAVIVPVDARAVVEPLQAPPPISGGTLAVTPDGRNAVVADPDRNRVSVVGLDAFDVHQIALEPGDEPGRVLAADGGRAYVALRRGGAVAVIDVSSGTLLQRVPVCAAPRGLALQAASSLLHVACAEGRLVSLRVTSGMLQTQPERDLQLETDLRDVVVQGDELWVSTFKRAEVLRLDASGTLQARTPAGKFMHFILEPRPEGGDSALAPPVSAELNAEMQPHLAFRTLSDANGGVFMLHQGSTTQTVKIDAASTQPSTSGSPYGGGGLSCSGIVGPALTRVDAKGKAFTVPVESGVLSVDMALINSARELAVIQAGSSDPDAPRPRVVFDADSDDAFPTTAFASAPGVALSSMITVPAGLEARLLNAKRSQLTVFSTTWGADARRCQNGRALMINGQATAVVARKRAEGQSDQLVVQSREPALLSLVTEDAMRGPSHVVIDLGGDSVMDTGHEIFHRDAGAGVACASCHPEGAEDGHVWSFNTVGLRRTQALHVGLEGTAPFHWNGEERDLSVLMEHVFVGRMGGVHQNPERQKALEHWLYTLQPPAAAQPRDMEAVERGGALFASADVGCRNCHSGAKLTDNQTVDVGTGAKLQVPSLRAVAYRAPFMHTGCAQTLRDRFNPACGGAAHGNVSRLSSDQIDDLVAYLQTL